MLLKKNMNTQKLTTIMMDDIKHLHIAKLFTTITKPNLDFNIIDLLQETLGIIISMDT